MPHDAAVCLLCFVLIPPLFALLTACTPAPPTPTLASTNTPTPPTQTIAPIDTATPETTLTAAAESADSIPAARADGEVTAILSVTTTRVRRTPVITGETVAELQHGDEVVVLGETDNQGYIYVRLADGSEGWAAKQNFAFENRFVTLPVLTPAP